MIRGTAFATFDEAEISRLLRPLRGDDDGSRSVDVFAGALWSCIVEPGDGVAGLLRLALGPGGSLDALAGTNDDLLSSLRRAGIPEPERYDLTAARARWAPRLAEVRFRSALRCARILGVRLVAPGDADWPAGLDDLGAHAPAALWVRGDAGALAQGPGVAIVGCRAASGYGEQVSSELAASLGTRGLTIFSGGAYGIDGMAHRSAVASGATTVAVMAGGVDRLYPAGHHELLTRVAESGAIVSEVPCGTSPSRWRFLQRNRLLAAMSVGTVVVEAGFRSGALNTVTHARALERPVGAVPGPITSPASDGCHRLLREPEVTCVTGPEDVLEMIGPSLVGDQGLAGFGGADSAGRGRRATGRPAPEVLRLLDALSERRPRDEEHLARLSGLGAGVVRATLAVLELEGQVVERSAGWVRVVS